MTEYPDDMIERIAEAIWNENAPEFAPDYDDLELIDQMKVRMLAVALLRVMREPTAGMVSSAFGKSDAADIWRGMIDQVLQEE